MRRIERIRMFGKSYGSGKTIAVTFLRINVNYLRECFFLDRSRTASATTATIITTT